MIRDTKLSPVVGARITKQEAEMVLGYLLRCTSLFLAAKSLLQPKHFDPIHERHLKAVWAAALLLADQGGRGAADPGLWIQLDMKATEILTSAGEPSSADEVSLLKAFLTWTFETEEKAFSPEIGRGLLRRFLNERALARPVQDWVKQWHDRTPETPAEAISELARRAAAIESLGRAPALTLDGDWAEYLTRLERFRGREMIGLKTGLQGLDERTLGLRGLIVLGRGRTSARRVSPSSWGWTSARTTRTPASFASRLR